MKDYGRNITENCRCERTCFEGELKMPAGTLNHLYDLKERLKSRFIGYNN